MTFDESAFNDVYTNNELVDLKRNCSLLTAATNWILLHESEAGLFRNNNMGRRGISSLEHLVGENRDILAPALVPYGVE